MVHKKFYCEKCKNKLKRNNNGMMFDKINNKIVGIVYYCEYCNQSYALTQDNKFCIIPFNKDMEKIENE